MTEGISSTLDGTNDTPHFRDVPADVQNTRYSTGHLIKVSEQKKEWGRNKGPHLERIHGADEVWAMCFRTPPPGWRLFGRFLCKDVFVGLVFLEKFDVVKRYEEVGGRVIEEWEKLFNVPPLRSLSLDDYIGHVWMNIDEEEQP